MTNATKPSSESVRPGRWCLALGLAVLCGWLVLALPVWWFRGLPGLEGLTLAATLCLIPGWLVFALYSQYGTAAPVAVLIVAMLGRMAVVLVGALLVKQVHPGLDLASFALCLGAFYVLTLAVETKLLSKSLLRDITTDDSEALRKP